MRDRDLAVLRDFDALPDDAYVRLPIVQALFSISRATVWRWCEKGDLPAPFHVAGVTFWKVGELRARLRATQPRPTPPVPNAAPGGAEPQEDAGQG
jgi:predicted DNA-binding transcriptional regulator AlpA